ncbi:hypothetical protein E5676_scaffold293G00820 [Cucumis melo var. makuwa]|uniref:Ubiquitin-like protease family profile domain-containing protein n=1 Tax=Cucumis melo var. makuwa TaxID=1194695 RepID=A0A5A7UA46_CUCMM|nr:hypothetical protein E6C27_scaffold88G001030 [Cucumis melo var. makuwa]TYK03582.1 hypothetical protein E5676_scaffold293G00820 [Cucumis melo var. makuwa]
MFKNLENAKNLCWHAMDRKVDGIMRHPTDTPSWRNHWTLVVINLMKGAAFWIDPLKNRIDPDVTEVVERSFNIMNKKKTKLEGRKVLEENTGAMFNINEVSLWAEFGVCAYVLLKCVLLLKCVVDHEVLLKCVVDHEVLFKCCVVDHEVLLKCVVHHEVNVMCLCG